MMHITRENVSELNAILRVKVGPEDYEPKVDGAVKEYQKKANMPGFRPGKVPAGLIKKMYGKSILADEINKLLSDSIYKYITENQLEVLGNPLPKEDEQANIDWDNQKEFEFAYEMGLAPRFDVPLSPKDKFTYYKVRIDDTLIDNYIKDLSRRYGQVVSAESAGENDLLQGDFVELDENGEILPGGIFKSSSLFMERIQDTDLKNQLIGLKAEDKVTLDAAKLRENNIDLANTLGIDRERAAGLASKFQFTVKNVTRLQPSEVNQELFNKVYGDGQVNNMDEFRKKVSEQLAAMFVNDSERKLYNDIVDELMAKTNFSLPDEFLKRWLVTVNEKPITYEQVDKEYEQYAKGLKWQLIENRIIKDHNITVTQEDVLAHTKNLVREQYAKYGQIDISDEDLTKATNRVLSNKDEAKRIYEQLYGLKVMDLFKSTFTIEPKEVEYDEFFKKKE